MITISKFADCLARDRFNHGMTQKEYAARLGVPLSSYIPWELGDRLPCGDHYRQILDSHSGFYETRALFRKAYTSDKLRDKRRRRRAARRGRGNAPPK